MLQKEKSTTKSLKSGTNNDPLQTSVQFVKGVGPRIGAIFASRGILTVKDLLTFFPRAYEDRTKLAVAAELIEGERATIAVKVLGTRKIPTRTGRSILEVRCADESGPLNLKYFHAPRGMESRFKPGQRIVASGNVKFFMNRPEIAHPEITWNADSDVSSQNVGRIIPIYTEIEGIPSRQLRKILWEALQKFAPYLKEDLPERFLRKYHLPLLADAIREIHFPGETEKGTKEIDLQKFIEFDTPSHWRLVYEEFFKFEYLVLKQKLKMEKERAYSFGMNGGKSAIRDLQSCLPFELTKGQQNALEETLNDLSQHHPMNRLIQGDVGSGKTAVAFLSAGAVLSEGAQVALMAPTEILAEQHYRSAMNLFGGKLKAALLTGKTPASERARLQERLSSGEPLLLIGTHALLEEPVQFACLRYVLIDEQHRFGVEQRRTLRAKGIAQDPETSQPVFPHSLILTATPIPRTLALTAYADLSVSTIKELPPGRSPVLTKVIRGNDRGRAFETIRSELRAGRQAYFIFPLVNESEAEGFTNLKSAIVESERLARDVFPEFKVGLLHGQMKPQEKTEVMERFKKNEIQILVSTTVVEVGVDVPNATIMVVEHAERFGLSQLHQLRGRVGRGQNQSYCFLFSHQKNLGEVTAQRLEVLEETTDGFKIAEADLEIRGPGEFLGTRQSGGLPFRIAQLTRDRQWLLRARDDAQALLEEDPELLDPENISLHAYYLREGTTQFERLRTS